MCQFFSFCTDETGKKYYFNWVQRQGNFDGADSHDHIMNEYHLKDGETNCYEYNPLTKVFAVDKIKTVDDRIKAERWVKRLDFKTIVEPLIVKPIVNPFDLPKVDKPTRTQIAQLKKWASVRDSVWASVGASVGASVWASVWASVGASVGASVRASVRDSVWASVRASVRDSVWASVRDSVRASVWAYTSSFFDIKYKYDFSPCVKLWEAGLVPSFDRTTWRLHSGKKADVVYEWVAERI
jgi:hypothetical protein